MGAPERRLLDEGEYLAREARAAERHEYVAGIVYAMAGAGMERPCLIAEVLSPSTAAIDTREKLHAYRGIESLRYYLIVDSDRVAVSYYVRSAQGDWLSASLDPGERLQVQCDPVSAELTLASIYEDTGLSVA